MFKKYFDFRTLKFHMEFFHANVHRFKCLFCVQVFKTLKVYIRHLKVYIRHLKVHKSDFPHNFGIVQPSTEDGHSLAFGQIYKIITFELTGNIQVIINNVEIIFFLEKFYCYNIRVKLEILLKEFSEILKKVDFAKCEIDFYVF